MTFRVDGLPAPKGSAKGFLHAQTSQVIVHADNRDALKAWEATVRVAALRLRPRARLTGAVALTVAFTLPRPRSVSVASRPYPIVKPDLSKLVRGIEDAMTGVLYLDDAQIVQTISTKHYGAPGETPGAVITLAPVEGGR